MARKASCCARRPKTSDPGVAKLVEAAEPGGGGQPSQEAAARRPAVTINAQPSPSPSPPTTTTPTPTPTPPSSAPPAAASAAAPLLSGVLGRVIEATVRARVFDLRLAIVLFGIFVVGGLDNGLDALLLLFR